MKIGYAVINIKLALMVLTGLFLAGAKGIGGARVEPAKLLVRGVSGQELLVLLLLAMVNIVEFELGRGLLSYSALMIPLGEVHD